MGFLDGLKNKINESGYADKVSAGLTKLGEGLESGSEKIQALASSLKSNSTNGITESGIEEKNQMKIIQKEEVSTEIMTADSAQIDNAYSIMPTENQRQAFYVNENDSNETRQVKEVLQDTNEVVQSVNQIVNSEVARNFSEAAKVIAISYSAYKLREQEIEKELENIAQQNQFNLEAMKLAYQNCNPRVDELISEVKKLLNDLRTFEGKNLTEKELTQYNGLITLITNLSRQAMSLYEKIMG